MPQLKLRSKLLISFVLLNLVCTGIATFAIYSEMRPHFLEAVEYTLMDMSRFLASELAAQAESDPRHALNSENLRRASKKLLQTRFPQRNYYDRVNHSTVRIYVTDAKGTVVFDSKDGEAEGRDFSEWRDVHRSLRGEYGARASRTDPADPGTSTHFVSAPIIVAGQTAGVISVGKPVESVQGVIRYAKARIVMIFLLSALAALLVGAAASYWISRPVLSLEHYIKNLSSSAFPRLPADEIGALGSAFEALRVELEGKKYVENYVHNLTHEIKAPLTAILGAAELVQSPGLEASERGQLLANIRSEAVRLQGIAEKLLELASLEARDRRLAVEEFDLKLMIEEVVESFEVQCRALGIELRVDSPEHPRVRGERFLLWRALANLVQNAIEFSPEGSRIEVGAAVDGNRLRIAVADRGTGIPEFALARVTERFFSLERPRTAKKSSGLGLSFVAEVMRLHSGHLALEARAGGGTIASVDFPVY
jgi:two-component system sensor histidine kinase CreC